MPSSFDYFTDHAIAAVTGASIVGAESSGKLVTPADLAIGLLRYQDGNVARWRRESGFDADRAVMKLNAPPNNGEPRGQDGVRFDNASRRVLTAAITQAMRSGAHHVGTEHVLAALVGYGPPEVIETFLDQGVTADTVTAYVAAMGNDPEMERLAVQPGRSATRGWEAARSRLDPREVPLTRRTSLRRQPLWFAVAVTLALLVVFITLSMV